MRSIGFISAKGGCAKTTSALNLAVGLARHGQKVLAIDTDPQGNLSHVMLRGEKPRHPTVAEVLTAAADARSAIVPTHFDRVDLMPADAGLADATAALTNEVGRERRLRLAMAGVAGGYGYVIVDTAPTRSVVTANVLNFVGEVFVPLTPSLFGILGLGQLQGDVEQVRRFLDNRELRIGGILLTMTERNNVNEDIERQLRELYGPVVFDAKIPRSIKVEEAHARHEAVWSYANKSPGAVAYEALTREVLSDGRAQDRVVDPRRNPRADSAA